MNRRGAESYQPYAVDWRFLPEPALLAKDFVRYYLTAALNGAAGLPFLRQLWAETVGRRTISAIISAKLLFIHVPKAAGTSVSQRLYGRNLPHYTAEFYFKTFPHALRGVPSFAILRDPVERAVSAFRYLRSGGTPLIAVDRYQLSRLRGLETFDSFVDFLHQNRTRILSLIGTIHPQSHFVCDPQGRVLVDRLCCLQGENGLPRELTDWLGLESLPRLNASEPTTVEVSPAARRKLLEIYSLDHQLFEAVSARGGFARSTELGLALSPQAQLETSEASVRETRRKLLRSSV